MPQTPPPERRPDRPSLTPDLKRVPAALIYAVAGGLLGLFGLGLLFALGYLR